MKRWVGLSAAVGSATAAVVAGSAWAIPVEFPIVSGEETGNPPVAHDCGHRDTVDARVERGGGDPVLVVHAVDGVGDPVEAAFDGTTVRVSSQPGAAAGAGSAELRLPLPRVGTGGEVRVEATFDDGITRCSWTASLAAPRGR